MFSLKAKYALRALAELATRRPEGELALVSDLAARQGAPKRFLETAMLDLRKHGVVYSRRGPGGGYGLNRAPERITLGEVVRILDGPLAPTPCTSLTAYRACADCGDEATCTLRPVMQRLRDATASVLDGTTLRDLCERQVDSADRL